MRVSRDFDAVYAAEEDPWNIGDADADRYEVYRDALLRHASARESILDIGVGMGAFLARFRDEFDRLVGVEISHQAIERGAARFPFIEFVEGSATDLGSTPADEELWDAIVFSDVIAYFDERGKRASLEWVADHLAAEGKALVAAWCPGGDYPTPDELRQLVRRDLVIDEERLLESDHVAFVCRARRVRIALTVDYETWQPVPEGRRIDWHEDIFKPTERLFGACERTGARLTLFAEMGEYLWLRAHNPEIADQMDEQWRDAVRRGHDVQLHLHPAWLPELGAHRKGEAWTWDWSYARADDYPGDLGQLIHRCVEALERAIQPVDPAYRVTTFRAGAYEAQPFARLYDALAACGVVADSSVYAGGRRAGRHYDYTLAYSAHQPYFANRFDPQLKAPPAERAVVELPITTMAFEQRWTFDADKGAHFATDFLAHRERSRARAPSTERSRRERRIGAWVGLAYVRLPLPRPAVNALLPRRLAWLMTGYRPEALVQHEYHVLVGHTKADLDVDAIERQLHKLAQQPRFDLLSLSEMQAMARAELEQTVNLTAEREASRQVEREYTAVLSDERNETQSRELQRRIPLDRRHVLDLGCGAGAWSARIATEHQWMHVVGVDVGEDFIAHASRTYGSERVRFEVHDFAHLDLADGSFDCVYADNSLEHAFDVDRTLAEIHRVLGDGGLLVAAMPSDARNPRAVCDNHTWKTAPHEVRMRLEAAGFSRVRIDELDTFRRLGASPFPPAADRMMYITAWKQPMVPTDEARIDEILRWVYGSLDPSRFAVRQDAAGIVAEGHAWCAGYAVVAATALAREQYPVRFVSMVAEGHPRGRGPTLEDTHEVVEVTLPNGARHVVDPMAGVRFACPIERLLVEPKIADLPRDRDERYRERGYDLYATSFWYERVRRVSVRDPGEEAVYEPVASYVGRSRPSPAHVRRAFGRARQAVRRRLAAEVTVDPA